MPTSVFSKEIVGKTAMTSSGYVLGNVEDVVIDTKTGEMKYILIRMTAGMRPGQKIDSKGRAVYAFTTLRIADNNLIIV